ncbi:MAG: NAD/NADP octopine/nopaline dehydrogenase family protein [Thermaerobacterales bacterium]
MPNQRLRFTVVGAGHGGQAMAAYLAQRGHSVSLLNKSFDRIRLIAEAGGIYLKGVLDGLARLDRITIDPEAAIERAHVILVVVPANAHGAVAARLAPFLTNGQIVILNPGRTGGALEFRNILRQEGNLQNIIIAETQTFLFASRVTKPIEVTIYGVKRRVGMAALPANRTAEVLERVSRAFPQFYSVNSVLDTSLDNLGAIFHPAPTLLNAARIETTGGDFEYYREGISPAVARVLESMDEERLAIARAYGVHGNSALRWLRRTYGARGRTLYEAVQNTFAYRGIPAPANLNTRYLFEDVPSSLVPMVALGHLAAVPTPTIETIVNLSCTISGEDYWSSGRNLDRLGLEGMSAADIRLWVGEGIGPEERTG